MFISYQICSYKTKQLHASHQIKNITIICFFLILSILESFTLYLFSIYRKKSQKIISLSAFFVHLIARFQAYFYYLKSIYDYLKIKTGRKNVRKRRRSRMLSSQMFDSNMFRIKNRLLFNVYYYLPHILYALILVWYVVPRVFIVIIYWLQNICILSKTLQIEQKTEGT